MAGGKPGLLARLFRWRRAREDVEPTLQSVIGWGVRRALARFSSSDRPVRTAPIELDALLAAAAIEVPAYLAAFYLDTDIPELLMIIPERTIRVLSGAAPARPDVDVPPLVGELAGGAATVLSPSPPDFPPLHRYFARCAAADIDELAWRASGSVAFRLEIETGPEPSEKQTLYACVAEQTAARMAEALASDRSFFAAIRSRIHSEEQVTSDPALLPRGLNLRAGREFLLGALACPPRVPCGKHLLEAVPTGLVAAPDRKVVDAATGVWAAGSCELAGRPRTAWYFFPTADEGEAARVRGSLGAVASCLFRAGMEAIGQVLGTQPGTPSVTLPKRAPAAGLPTAVQLRARIRIGTTLLAVEVFLEHSILSLLLRRLVSGPELAATSREPVSIVPLCLLANEMLLRRQLPALPRMLAAAESEAGPLPFGVFADLVTQRDLAVTLQNHVLLNLSGRSLRCLFSWSEPATDDQGQALPRIVTPYLFDEERLISVMPRQAQEAWARDGALVDVTREEHRELTRSIFAGIDRAVRRGALLLSPRARHLLEREVRPALRARTEAELTQAASSGIPFSTISGMTRPQIQQFFARCTTRSICLSLFGAGREGDFVAQHVNAVRRRQIREDFALLARQREQGLLEEEEIVAAKRELERMALKMLEELARGS